MKRRTGWIAGLAAVAVLLTASATAFGYTGQVGGSVTVAAHGTVTCEAPFTLTATFVDANGKPVSGQSVDWSFVTSPSASDTISPTPTITNSRGVATTTATLGPVSGTRRIRATAGTVSATAVLNPSCGGAGGVLPNTSTLPTETPSQDPPLGAMLLGALFLVIAGGLTVRRLVLARA
jgi:Bacterial Ig-like domain (group 1)